MDPNTRALIMGAGGGAAAEKIYVEDVFSTFLYTGNGSTQTITNGIDLSGKGGLVWIKARNNPGYGVNHALFDTARTAGNELSSIDGGAQFNRTDTLTSFGSSGFSLGADVFETVNKSSYTYASWTFRKAAKFFDVVTYVGNGASNRDISHSLGSTPGCVIVKATSAFGDWAVWHRNNGSAACNYFNLNGTNAAFVNASNNGFATSSVIKVGAGEIAPQIGNVNNNGVSYVAYLFAHDAGGFGDSGNDNVISCGSFTMASGDVTVNLGYEPQFLLIKASTANAEWGLYDVMRGLDYSNPVRVAANSGNAEAAIGGNFLRPTATGFVANSGWFGSTASFIYIAIRRGPMKTPTDATKVFAMDTLGGTAPNPPAFNSGFPVDLGFYKGKGAGADWAWADRLRGAVQLSSTSTAAEFSNSENKFDYMDGWNTSTAVLPSYPGWMFRRAPGFFDAVAYTGTGSARTVSHNLGVAPELMIVKKRSGADEWVVYHSALGATNYLWLQGTNAQQSGTNRWNDTAPSSTVFSIGSSSSTNGNGATFIAYLFATLAGISKVGNYTGTGTTLNIDCGFTNGARFVLIKRTDSAGDWYVWDTARGIIAANDPYLLLNSTAAEVTNTDFIDPLNAGFQISSTAPAAINANGGTFIYLAIA